LLWFCGTQWTWSSEGSLSISIVRSSW